jgi:tetratricopeptide (TPR) repeat protein
LEMLLGSLPFSMRVHPVEELLSHSYFAIAKFLLEKNAVPKRIQVLILDCIAPQSERRPNSYSELRQDLISTYSRVGGWLENTFDPLTETETKYRKLLLPAEMEYAEKHINNLRAVGRDDDAQELARECLDKLLKEYMNAPADPAQLGLFTTASIRFRELDIGKKTLEAIIQANEQHPFVDLTLVYFYLGTIYHQLGSDPEKELWCYEMAVSAKPAPNCKYVASKRMKAKAHLFAAGPANRLMRFDLCDQHEAECRRLVPDVDFEDPLTKVKFVEETRS